MGTFKDIIDVAGDLGKTSGELADNVFSEKKYRSLSRRAAEGTLQFPVLTSRSLDIETTQMVTKALERNFASFAQIAMTMAPAFGTDSDKDLAGYVRRFHQNQGIKANLNDLHNAIASVDESAKEQYKFGVNEDVVFAVGLYEQATRGIIKDNKDGMYDVLESVETGKLNDVFRPAMKNRNFLLEADKPEEKGSGVTVINNIKAPKTWDAKKSTSQAFTNTSANHTIPNEMLKSNDAKKANELVPTMMHMRVRSVDRNGTEGKDIDFLVGIKAMIHPVKSEEMIDNILDGIRYKGKLFNFIRWTSGEITFFKDFLFGIKQMKLDVANQSSGHSSWWVALKRRKGLAKINNRLHLPKSILPNASIVITMEEAEYIKNSLGYDLMNEAVVDRLMQEYFLLSFVIVDTGGQIAHFLFDGQSYYQSISFSGLEKGTHQGNNGMDMKDLMRLVQRV